MARMSPRSRVMIREAASMRAGMRKTMCFVFESCRTTPLTRSRVDRLWGSATDRAGTPAETGANVSKPFAAVHGEPSLCAGAWRSRAVMSKKTA